MTAPEPTNNPAPITPPSEIIVTWRRLRPLCSPPLSMSAHYPHIAVIHHLAQPFVGNAAQPLGPVRELFDSLPDLDEVDGIVSFGGEKSAPSRSSRIKPPPGAVEIYAAPARRPPAISPVRRRSRPPSSRRHPLGAHSPAF